MKGGGEQSREAEVIGTLLALAGRGKVSRTRTTLKVPI